MPKTSYAEKISDAEVMVSGLTKNLTRLTRRGIDDPFIQSIATLKQEAVSLNKGIFLTAPFIFLSLLNTSES